MKNNRTVSNKGNAAFCCNCYACKDSGFQYGSNPVLIEDTDSRIVQFLGRDFVK